MSSFLLLTVPFLQSKVKFYTAAYVTSLVKSSGWDCSYKDLNHESYLRSPSAIQEKWDTKFNAISEQEMTVIQSIMRDIIANLNINQFAIIGITLYQSCRKSTIPILTALRDLDYNGIVMFGGPDCFPSYKSSDYFHEDLTPDLILTGEAEIALPMFLKEFAITRDHKTAINGFLYQNSDGTIHNTGTTAKPMSKDLDTIADFTIFGEGYVPLASAFTSKGCINKCAFCSEWGNFNPLRYRKPDIVAQEISIQSKNGACKNGFWLLDSNFNTSIQHVHEFANALISHNVNLPWKTMGCFRVELDRSSLHLLKQSGLTEMMIGLESASQVVLDYMGKNYSIDNAQEQILRFTESKIHCRLPIMNGFPGESTSDFITTCAFILRYRSSEFVSFSYSNTFSIFDNTYVSDFPDDFGIRKDQMDAQTWEQYDGLNTFEVRQLRRGIAMHLMRNTVSKKFSVEDILESVNFNNTSVALEIAQLISLLGIACNNANSAKLFLQHIISEGSHIAPHDDTLSNPLPLTTRLYGLDIISWLATDKQNHNRKTIIDYMWEAFETLDETIDKHSVIALNQFKKSLYMPISISSSPSICSLQVLQIRHTEYDNGKFIIVEGLAWDSARSLPADGVIAVTNDHIIEFQYGLPDHSRDSHDPLYNTRFWGKVKLKYIHDGRLTMCTLLNGSTNSQHSITIETLSANKINYITSV